MGSKLKKIALPIAAIGLMAATGGAAAPALTGAASSAGATAAAAQAAAAKAAAAKLAAGQSMHPLIAAGSALGKKTAITAAMNPLTVAGINAAGAGAAAPTGLMGLLSKAGTFAKTGLMNPLSAKGAATYGGLGTLAGMMTEDKRKLDTSKDDDAAQAAYDYHMMMSKGIMSPEDARKSFATYGKGMKGDYTPGTEMGTGRYEELYPSLNYSGLTRYNPNPIPGPAIDKEKLREYNPYVFAADGGMIDPLEEMPIITPMETEEERRMREAMEQIKMLQAEGFDFSQGNPVPDPYAEAPMTSMNYQGRADGGLMELAGSAGDPGTMEDADEHSYRLFNKPYLELDEFELDEFNEEMARLRSKFMADGGLTQLASAPHPMAERFDMLENLALDMYKKPLEELQPKEIELLEGMIEEMDQGMADGGSVPQTKSIPQGMQLDGRGGGFIPMGAKEKHDDVPAMLAKNEFVMTSDAVKAAGGGSVNKGAQVMYDLMNSLESKV